MQRPTLQTALLLGPQSDWVRQAQAPSEQKSVTLQLVVQSPQWELSVLRFTQVPSQEVSSVLLQELDDVEVPKVVPPIELFMEPPAELPAEPPVVPPVVLPKAVDVPPEAWPPVSGNEESDPPKFLLPPIWGVPPELTSCEPPDMIDDDCELDAPDVPPWVGSRVPPASVPPMDESPPFAVWLVPAFPEWAKLDCPPALTVKSS